MIAIDRERKARESDPDFWAEWDEFHGLPVDRSPAGQAKHERLFAEYAAKIDAAANPSA